MNFFGHFVIAHEAAANPAFVLGSMLPDFATMSRSRLRGVRGASPQSELLRNGVRVHHATDSVFHSTEDFISLSSRLSRALEAAGVRRGTCMAVGHIGVELLLDRWLMEDAETAPYLEALRFGQLAVDQVDLGSDDATERFAGLMDRLVAYGTRGYEDVSVIRARLSRALHGRERLAIHAEDETTVERLLQDFDPLVQERTPAWLGAIRRGVHKHELFVQAMKDRE